MRILCLGDSIMQYNDFTTYPQTGWVQELYRFFPDSTQWVDYARNGRSTKSFIDEGRFDRVMAEASKGDFALIQFGHNDEKKADPSRYTDPSEDGAFRKNLSYFIRELRSKGVLPLLLTPMARRMFIEGKIQDSHGQYCQAINEVAKKEKVPFIDMNSLTMDFLQKMGEENTRRFYMNFDSNLYENYPEGKSDNSHLRPDGAYAYSEIAAREIKKIAASFPEYAELSQACMTKTNCHYDEIGDGQEIDDEFTVYQK